MPTISVQSLDSFKEIINQNRQFCFMGEIVIVHHVATNLIISVANSTCLNIIFTHPQLTVFMHADTYIDMERSIATIKDTYVNENVNLDEISIYINGGIGPLLSLFGKTILTTPCSSVILKHKALESLRKVNFPTMNIKDQSCQTGFRDHLRNYIIPITAIDL